MDLVQTTGVTLNTVSGVAQWCNLVDSGGYSCLTDLEHLLVRTGQGRRKRRRGGEKK